MHPPRLFTVREAEAALPLVRRVVGDLLEAHPRWTALVARFELLSAPRRAEEGESEEIAEVREAASREAERINTLLLELERIGCLFKGFDGGLVDFYALREDRLVYLCWRHGEDHIAHWHEVDAGFAGRQPLDQWLLTETVSG